MGSGSNEKQYEHNEQQDQSSDRSEGHSGQGAASAMEHMKSRVNQQRRLNGEGDSVEGVSK